MKVYFAADHAGFELKQALLTFVRSLGYETEDCGALRFDQNDDYPDLIGAGARLLSRDAKKGIESRGIFIGASGQGEAMAANRFKGVRCALYYGSTGSQKDVSGHTLDIIASSREHNDANALALGARFVDADEAKQVVEAWLTRPFSREPRHVRRIERLDDLA
ncbi:MAG TPA: RpiB/LacA/LacB family sugar-phosphate isomerase [Candidatus Paceibacterota bacterium]|jgi:ribose 5-phosphate isomerase B|nr:RpiB/LacA/LacB family sugar-phosphate isomerase [Candidatus Paceibacterota bacterium]